MLTAGTTQPLFTYMRISSQSLLVHYIYMCVHLFLVD
jgi:hypothetical protein